MARETSDPMGRLYAAGLLFAVGSAIHIADHLRRGQGSVTDTLNVAGTLALVLQVVVVTLIFTRHRLAPLVAAAVGPSLALGFIAAHWLPHWSALSDPLWDMTSAWPALSYLASTVEIAGAVAVGLAGWSIVRREGLASYATSRPVTSGGDLGRSAPRV
jgi:hypothetical protein